MVRDRINDRTIIEATLIRAAIIDVVGGGDHFSQLIEMLRG